MNRRPTYGNTWWGKAWIKAMEKIDINTNRLPRGRSYAKKVGRITVVTGEHWITELSNKELKDIFSLAKER
ncbi:MAG: hypothetical protein HQL06_16205 [Nitrospirae bacterium]|nr:hypothetical protein [Nitrospirota bacterium]